MKLFIPQGIKLEKEEIDGFNQKRLNLLITNICINIGVGIFNGILFSSMIVGVGTFGVLSIFAFGLLQKGESNLSAYDVIKQQRKFQKSQKRYYYKYESDITK